MNTTDVEQAARGNGAREFAELMRRAQRGELDPAGFRRCEQLIAEVPERGLPAGKRR